MLQRVVADYFAVRYPARSAGFGRQRDAERALALLFPGFLGGRRSVTTARTHAREVGADHQRRVRAEADLRGPVHVPHGIARRPRPIGERDRKSAELGERVSDSVDLRWSRRIKQKTNKNYERKQ